MSWCSLSPAREGLNQLTFFLDHWLPEAIESWFKGNDQNQYPNSKSGYRGFEVSVTTLSQQYQYSPWRGSLVAICQGRLAFTKTQILLANLGRATKNEHSMLFSNGKWSQGSTVDLEDGQRRNLMETNSGMNIALIRERIHPLIEYFWFKSLLSL